MNLSKIAEMISIGMPSLRKDKKLIFGLAGWGRTILTLYPFTCGVKV